MRLVAKNHGLGAVGSPSNEFVASVRNLPRDCRLSNRCSPAALPLEDVASTSSNLDNALGLGSLRHLENSWAGSALSRSPWVLRVSVDEKPQRTRNKEKTPAFFANVGDAIRSLREDIPRLFEKDLNYDIYTDNIIFKDPNVTFQGMKNYKTMFWSLRFHGRIFFKKLYVEVKRIWQPQDMTIKVRWTVHGLPRLFGENESLFDGISTYELDENGRIYEHSVNNVLLRDTPAFSASPILAGIDRALAGPSPQPYPGAWGCRMENAVGCQVTSSQGTEEQAFRKSTTVCSNAGGSGYASPAAVWQPLLWCLLMSMVYMRSEALNPHEPSQASQDQAAEQPFCLEG